MVMGSLIKRTGKKMMDMGPNETLAYLKATKVKPQNIMARMTLIYTPALLLLIRLP